MLRPYFCAYHSYLENMELLNSEERGRLFTALLEYSKDGTLIPLTGNERFVFPGIRSQIDRDKAQWEQIDNVKTANGRKGGRPKKVETEKANGFGMDAISAHRQSTQSTKTAIQQPLQAAGYWRDIDG